jgi:hypothetical protein
MLYTFLAQKYRNNFAIFLFQVVFLIIENVKSSLKIRSSLFDSLYKFPTFSDIKIEVQYLNKPKRILELSILIAV